MSKLGEMIRELCPDGVKYKKLGEVAYYAKERIKTQAIEVHNYVGVEHLLQEKSGRELSTSLPNADYVIGFCVDDILIGNIRPYLKKYGWLTVTVERMEMC